MSTFSSSSSASPAPEMKNILVTGATGCIGSNLTLRLLSSGYNVRIFHRPDSDLQQLKGLEIQRCVGDVRDPSSIKRAMHGCDTVFHCAALVSFRRQQYAEQYEVNVIGTRNIVRACMDLGVVRLVYTSSVAAVGYRPDGGLATEETPFNWKSIPGYRYSKFCAEQEVQNAVGAGLPAVIVNPSVVVGERDTRFHGGQIIRDIRKGRIPAYIEGGMNVVYVGDVVDGHVAAALHGRVGERYILAGENLTHREIFRRTAAIVGGHAPVLKIPLPLLRGAARVIEWSSHLLRVTPLITRDLVEGAGRNNWFSSEKAQRELGYSLTPFDHTIRKAYAWYTQQGLL
jgi:dihydroflavonol-4-reductase